MSLRDALQRIAERRPLSGETAKGAFLDLMEGRATDAQKGALLLGLAARGETPEEVAGAVSALREKMTPVASRRSPLVDTCGTGGDGAATFNVSTAAALVCAGAGVAVAKHGNRAVSSQLRLGGRSRGARRSPGNDTRGESREISRTGDSRSSSLPRSIPR